MPLCLGEAAPSSTDAAGDRQLEPDSGPTWHLPHVHRVLQSGHFVVRQEVIDGNEGLSELLLEPVHSEGVRADVTASTRHRRRGVGRTACRAEPRAWGGPHAEPRVTSGASLRPQTVSVPESQHAGIIPGGCHCAPLNRQWFPLSDLAESGTVAPSAPLPPQGPILTAQAPGTRWQGHFLVGLGGPLTHSSAGPEANPGGGAQNAEPGGAAGRRQNQREQPRNDRLGGGTLLPARSRRGFPLGRDEHMEGRKSGDTQSKPALKASGDRSGEMAEKAQGEKSPAFEEAGVGGGGQRSRPPPLAGPTARAREAAGLVHTRGRRPSRVKGQVQLSLSSEEK